MSDSTHKNDATKSEVNVETVKNEVNDDKKEVKTEVNTDTTEDEKKEVKTEEKDDNNEDNSDEDDSPEALYRQGIESGLISDEDEDEEAESGDWTYACSNQNIIVSQIEEMAGKKEWNQKDHEKMKELYENFDKQMSSEDVQCLPSELIWCLLGKSLRVNKT